MNLDKQFPWIKKIPQGSHGSGKYQKKYWKVISDIVRIRDEKKGCITCRRHFVWNDPRWQACHYKSWASCRGYSKYDTKNIFGGCSYCNTGWNANTLPFKDNIIKHYGQERIDYIDTLDRYPTQKMDNFEICLLIKEALKEFKTMEETPDYWQKIKNMI